MALKHRLLIVDDEPRICEIMSTMADRWGYETQTATNGQDAKSKLESFLPEIVLTDLKMPTMSGDELLVEVKKIMPTTQVILMTAHATVKSAVDAMKAGAFDYIMKPFDNDEMELVLERAGRHLEMLNENASLRAEMGVRFSPRNIIGDSEGMREVLELIERVGPTKATVMILGESGTGKELVARAVHSRSQLASKPFIALNCAALTETLLESELFGHEKGAFTGATRTHHGKFEDADGGTIFLDEIGETTTGFQTKLLRVLQEGTFTRVGGNEPIKVDVRVLAATNRNLEAMVERGEFRGDLFYRLKVVPIEIPPLRERPEDIVTLSKYFVRKASQENGLPNRTLSDDAIEALKASEWKGNVRELENTIERAVILTRNNVIEAEDLWLPSHQKRKEEDDTDSELAKMPLSDFIDEMTKEHVLRALEARNWKKQEASDLLQVDRATLYRMIKRFGIDRE